MEVTSLIRRSDALANQTRVLEVAQQVFAEQGIAAEVKDVAERAGVGVATIYRGFGSKEGLVQAAIEQADQAIARVLETAEAAPAPTDALRALVAGLLAYAEAYGWLIQASVAGTGVRRSQASMERREQHRSRVAGVIQRAIDSGAVRAGISPDVVRLAIDGATVMLTIRKMRHEPYPPVESAADGLMRMLLAPGGGPTD